MPEAREEAKFEQVSGPVNQPKPHSHMIWKNSGSEEESRSGEDPLVSSSEEEHGEVSKFRACPIFDSGQSQNVGLIQDSATDPNSRQGQNSGKSKDTGWDEDSGSW